MVDNLANFGLEEENKSYKNKKGRKRWVIEYKLNPESKWYKSHWHGWQKDWGVWKRYSSETARDQALNSYIAKSQQKNNWENNFLYRAGN